MTTFNLDLSWNVSAAHPEAEAGLGAVLCNVTPPRGAEWRAVSGVLTSMCPLFFHLRCSSHLLHLTYCVPRALTCGEGGHLPL